ncbi:putative KRAB box and zinc finger C2H2 type domain containing protein [Operophtera brumata]|uniref:Putative KRAB box and zinc finger C2H2 type domain containing protein n=1 Tax=Operophtera brumata TaxID=104452 RepID=A0A0L7L0Y9_OPEBR|nr:putative KRAB box and zinc finger C2H2 type domain containing protein [Operophtera brumata]
MLVILISEHFPFQVQSDDRFPKNMCTSCYNCLTNFYDYKKLAEKVDLQLHQYYDNIITTDKSFDDSLENPIKTEFNEPDVDYNSIGDELDVKEIKDEDESQESIENSSYNNIQEVACTEYNLQTKKIVKRSKNSKKDIFECMDCPKTFKAHEKYKQHLNIHKKENGDNDAVKCDICSASFRSTNSLAAHKRKHVPKGRVLSCQYCSKVFKKMSHLKRHEGSHDVNRTYKCSLCPKSYHLESRLSEHMHKHSGIKPHPCPICPKGFAHLSTLTNHLKLHTRGKPFLCPTCGKSFDSNTNMTQHLRRHLGLKQFACSLCPWKFMLFGKLTEDEQPDRVPTFDWLEYPLRTSPAFL